MRINKSFCGFLLTMALMAPLAGQAQESSINTYSPYTLYGLGNLTNATPAAFSSMAGTSIGFRGGALDVLGDVTLIKINTSNPASLSSMPQRTILFDVGMTGTNSYISQRTPGAFRRTSFNSFNVSNISLGFPLARRLGMAVSLSPYSDIGYRIKEDDFSDDVLSQIGIVRNYYQGDGDFTEAKVGIGWEPWKRLSIGAEMIYMWGHVNRYYQQQIAPFTGSGTYNSLSANTSERVSRMYAAFGMQYTAVSKPKTRVTIGATYRMGGSLNSTITDYIPSSNISGDTVRLNIRTSATSMPQVIGAGVFFHRPTFAVGVDYIYQDWGNKNSYDGYNSVGYTDTHTIRLGAQFTPNRFDIRNFFKRNTYKIGFRHSNHYMTYRDIKIYENAVTMGVEIPFHKMYVSNVNIGFEVGQRGKLTKDLMREYYFKINVGVTLFGRDFDYWFDKYKYN